MAKSKSKVFNIIFLIVVAVLIIPQTRLPIQVFFNKLMATALSPTQIDKDKQEKLVDYDWILQSTSGTTLDFKDTKNKVVVVNFWATWCPPCIAEMPSLQELYNTYKTNEEVVFVFVSNEDIEVIDAFMSKNEFSFEVYQSLTTYPKNFDVSSIPRTFIINRNGHIIVDKTGAADWNSNTVITILEQELKMF